MVHNRARAAAAARWRKLFTALCLTGALCGCARTGDFGRPVPSVWNNTLGMAGDVIARGREEPVSLFRLTDDETELRDRSWRFVMPARESSWFQTLVGTLVRTRILPQDLRLTDPSFYYVQLATRRSPAPLYRQISEDAMADAALIGPFVETALRVLQADEWRRKSLAHVKDLDPDQIENAAMRMAENRCLIAIVREESSARLAAYRFALERVLIETPDIRAIEAERSLSHLATSRASLDNLNIASLRQNEARIAACAYEERFVPVNGQGGQPLRGEGSRRKLLSK
jgi:hypothetical protein